MGRATTRSFRGIRTASFLLAAGMTVSAFGTGCTSEKEKAMNAITKAVEECRKAEPEGRFYKVELFDDKADEILHVACSEEVDKFEMTSDVSAHAFTGPVRWGVRVDKETGLWTLYGAEWSNLQRARSALKDGDPSEESLGYAAEHFAKAQEEMPSSAWLRLRRLESVLDLRMKTRKADTPNPVSIGEDAQKVYKETMAWAKESDDLDTQVEAQYLVVNHLNKYLGRIDMVLSADGSSDEWLIKAAEQAEKDGNAEKAAEYRKEVEETRKKREETHNLFTERRKKAQALLCEEASKLQPAGVENSDLQQQVVALKSSLDCMKKAKPVADSE
ncbi:hypothetical protein FIV42_18975 [Persicimonas caeni]|uniref:Uncharacterized protein n=1 Tax=Persicimonas caeni TaxID=2292766 RepID=A0A4Y6PWP7_PERCE|nr:hypothetical protein [Persicimonas caeni]QDG52748.1 hypothetical protein FIV42_18975 [Persicimonas caeni]QED33970.1 hypothetical protein FRD00_18970 [Persicimonas caeni]